MKTTEKQISARQKVGWKKIQTAPKIDYVHVDLWMAWGASPLTMGMADAFRVPNAYRKDGKWFHQVQGKELELRQEYITHWMPIPKAPKATGGAR